MRRVILIIFLFAVCCRPIAQQTPAQEAASAYAFILDNIILKELMQYPHFKDYRVATYAVKIKTEKDLLLYSGYNSFLWERLGYRTGTNTNRRKFDSLLKESISFDLGKVRTYSGYAAKLSELDSVSANSYRALTKLQAIENTGVYRMSNIVFSKDHLKCAMQYSHFQGGGYTVVLKRSGLKWEVDYLNMDYIE